MVLLVVGNDFMSLWQHGQDTTLLYELLTMTMLGLLASGVAVTLQNLPLIVNRLKSTPLDGSFTVQYLWLC